MDKFHRHDVEWKKSDEYLSPHPKIPVYALWFNVCESKGQEKLTYIDRSGGVAVGWRWLCELLGGKSHGEDFCGR